MVLSWQWGSQTAVKKNTVTLIVENTDFLNLLLYHKVSTLKSMFVICKEKPNMKHKPKNWDKEHAKTLGEELCDAILVIHARL